MLHCNMSYLRIFLSTVALIMVFSMMREKAILLGFLLDYNFKITDSQLYGKKNRERIMRKNI